MESLVLKDLRGCSGGCAEEEADLCGPAEAEEKPEALRITKNIQEMLEIFFQEATGRTGNNTDQPKKVTFVP